MLVSYQQFVITSSDIEISLALSFEFYDICIISLSECVFAYLGYYRIYKKQIDEWPVYKETPHLQSLPISFSMNVSMF